MTVSRFRQYSFILLAMASMLSGSQYVHLKYEPLKDLNDLIEEEFKRRVTQMERK